MELHFKRAWVESVHAALRRAIGLGRCFHGSHVEDTARPIEPAVWSQQHRIGGVVRIRTRQPLQHSDLEVRFAVAIGVF